jgi:hypothetical protein
VNAPRFLLITVLATIVATMGRTAEAQETPPSPPSSTNAKEADTTEEVVFASPDGKFAFLIDRGDDGQTIDLIHKKTRKVVQHIGDPGDLNATGYGVLWAPDSKRFALMTRMGHPNQDVTVYSRKGDKFQEGKIPDLTVEIPAKLTAGKQHPHVATNNWTTAERWNKDGSLVVTIDNTIDGAGHTATAIRTVLLGFDASGKGKILKSTVKYASRNDGE